MSGFWQEKPGLSPNRAKGLLRLLQLGLLNELRNPALLRPALAAAIASGIAAWLLRDIPAYAVLTLSEWLGRLYGVVAALWMTSYAARDLEGGTRAGLLFRAKPADGGAGMLVNWTVGLGLWLLLLAAAFVLPALLLTGTGGFAAGLAVLASFGPTALAVLTPSALAFAATRAFRHRAAGAALIVGWIALARPLAQLGLSPEFAPNALAWSFLALVGLTAEALIGERRWREEPVRPGITAIVLGLLCLPIAARAASALRGRAADGAKLSLVKLEPGQRVPAIEIQGAHGRVVRTADQLGKITFVFLFSARDAYSARSLNALRELQRELGPSGVQPLAIAIDADPRAGALIAGTTDYGFPLGFDRGAPGTISGTDAPAARTLGALALPMLLVTDRRRSVTEIRYDRHWSLPSLRAIALARLAEEPR